MGEPRITHCGVRDGDDEYHIECRFDDGQKFAAVKVDGEFPLLAEFIAAFLNVAAGNECRRDATLARAKKEEVRDESS